MINCANSDRNNSNCNCTYPGCPRHGICCECIAYHRKSGELPACYFDKTAEKTYNRSIENYMTGISRNEKLRAWKPHLKKGGGKMRKYIAVVLLAVSVLSITTISFAGDDSAKSPMPGNNDKDRMTRVCPMHNMIMRNAVERKMLATEDGSIVVMAGNKLIKYDKNLNLKKEVEINTNDKEICDSILNEMCVNCPMCRNMMKRPKTKQGGAGKK